MNEQELFNEMLSEVGPVEEDRAFDATAGSPLIISIFSSMIIRMLRKQTCKQKDAIVAAARKYIEQYVKNAIIANMMVSVLDTAISAMCPSDTNVVG